MPHRIPKRNYFNVAFSCRYIKKAPNIDGVLDEWKSRYLVPGFMELEEKKSHSQFFMAWNEDGIYMAINVKGKKNPINVNRRLPESADCLNVWLDMRDTRKIHRASKYCHQFTFLPSGGCKKVNKASGYLVALDRSQSKTGLCKPSVLEVASQATSEGYALEIAIPATALLGYDPVENPRIGFTYYLNDSDLGPQWWSVDKLFRFRDNPSMWGTAILTK